MTPEQLDSMIGYALSLILLVQVLATLARFLALRAFQRSYEAAPLQVPEAASHLDLRPNNITYPLIEAFRTLDFRRVGVTQLTGEHLHEPITTWVFASPTGTVYVEIFEQGGQGFASLFSVFDDEVFVETTYPKGVHIDQPDYHASTTDESITAAYTYHKNRVDELRPIHGEPVLVDNMAVYMVVMKLYVERFPQRRIATMRPPVIVRLATSLYGAVVILGGLVWRLIFHPDPRTLLLVIAPLFLPAMLADLALWLYLKLTK
jgi:hypothetical protein